MIDRNDPRFDAELEYRKVLRKHGIEENRQTATAPEPKGTFGDSVKFIFASAFAVNTVLAVIQITPAVIHAEGIMIGIFTCGIFGYVALQLAITAAKAFTNVINNHPDSAGKPRKRLPIKLSEVDYR